jgi:D-mannonate dehydratase
VSVTPGTAEWREERLWVLNTIEDLKTEQRKQFEAEAIRRVNVEEKGLKDIQAAHDKIRAADEKIRVLQNVKTELRLKNWIMTITLGASGAIIVELARAVLQGWK